jgi:spore coat polysaccharide biosynthesis protein SpsF
MGSQRFFGKVLYEVAGRPLLQYLLERLGHSCLADAIVVATSREAGDDPVADFCKGQGVFCYRGSLENVASRFLEVLDLHGFEAFVRINGDSPLLDQRLIDRGVDLFLHHDVELVTNVQPRTYPPGQSVEVMAAEAFKRGFARMRDRDDLEHVTRYFYRHPGAFKILNFAAPRDYGTVHLAVDTDKDMRLFAAILARMDKPHWLYGLDEILEIYRQVT